MLLRIDRVRRVEKTEPWRALIETGGHVVPSARGMTALQCPIQKTADSRLDYQYVSAGSESEAARIQSRRVAKR